MTSSNSQMHNDIMATGSKERSPLLAPGSLHPNSTCYSSSSSRRGCSGQPRVVREETYANTSPKNKKLIDFEAEAIHIILNGIGNNVYSIVDARPTNREMWLAIERLQQGEFVNIQDVKTKLFWKFGKFTSRDAESIESYYTRFYRILDEMIGNQLKVDNMQVNGQFFQQL
ncbi:hypothetical protein Tco_0894840 [Tanacetum coccineum]|uniref:Gag-Pol polyprotein n=1 Tax=Tanacetum coccineum TaxID=301880 RepID=A0ABQ5CFI6_9ASTR